MMNLCLSILIGWLGTMLWALSSILLLRRRNKNQEETIDGYVQSFAAERENQRNGNGFLSS